MADKSTDKDKVQKTKSSADEVQDKDSQPGLEGTQVDKAKGDSELLTKLQEVEEESKRKDGTIKSLTEKIDKIESRFKAFTNTDEESGEEELDPIALIEQERKKRLELEKTIALQQVTAGMVDEDGQSLPDSIKAKALESVDVTDLSPEQAVEAVKKQAKTLYDVYKDAKTVNDSSVESEKTRRTANEYIDTEITIIK